MEAKPANNVLFGDFCTVLEQLSKKRRQRQDQDRILSNFVNEFRINAGKVTGEKVTMDDNFCFSNS